MQSQPVTPKGFKEMPVSYPECGLGVWAGLWLREAGGQGAAGLSEQKTILHGGEAPAAFVYPVLCSDFS